MVGTGSPVAWHVKVAKSLPSSVESTMSDRISGATTRKIILIKECKMLQ